MLKQVRKHQNNFIFGALVLAIVLVMAFFGMDNLVSDKSQGQGTAAWVNSEPIPYRDFQRALEVTLENFRTQMGQDLDERFIAQFQIPQRTLDELIQTRLVAQQAKALGFRVSDSELAFTIRQAPVFQRNGRFDPELYRTVPNRGLEERGFRDNLVARQLHAYFSNRILVTPEMARREVQLKETRVDLTFARIDFKSLVGQPKPSPAELEAFEKQTPAAELRAHYDSHTRDYTRAAAVKLRQIRVGVPFQASADRKADARKKIDSIAQELTADTFAQVAKKRSDDEHAKKGGDVGWVERGTLEPALERAIDDLELNAVSPVVETEFGYFLLQVTEKRAEVTQPLEEVKTQVARSLWQQKRIHTLVAEKKAAWEKKLSNGGNLEPDLKAAQIEVKKTGMFAIGQGYVPQIGQNDALMDAVFKLTPKNPIAPQLFVNGQDHYFVRLSAVEHPKPAEKDRQLENASSSLETSLQTTFLTDWIETIKKDSNIRIQASFEAPI